jgi:type IV pilus assembly protein PilW
MSHRTPSPPGRRQRGLTIVELLVGFAVGLFIVGGATKLFVDYLSSNRKMLIETRLNQDLRAASDLVVRDLRRAGFWRNATSEIWVASTSGGTYTTNPYRTISVTGSGTCPTLASGQTASTSGNAITYYYAKDANDTADSATEQRGVRINNGALEVYNGGGWQPVTDTNAVTMSMTVCEYATTVELWSSCPCLTQTSGTGLSCTATQFQTGGSNFATRPRATVSEYMVTLTGTYPSDTTIKRTMSEVVRVRNDSPEGTCP